MTNPKTSTMNPARRAFLSKAANVAAGSAALTLAATMTPAAAFQNASDPIFAAIDAHRVAMAAVRAILDAHTILEKELPLDKCRSSFSVWEEKIVATDDPRWIDCERAVMRCWGDEGDAALDLVNVQPTTRAGLMALLHYAVSADLDGETWPTDLISDDGEKRCWHHFLIENVAKALADMVSA
jgi:hypothetical protein